VAYITKSHPEDAVSGVTSRFCQKKSGIFLGVSDSDKHNVNRHCNVETTFFMWIKRRFNTTSPTIECFTSAFWLYDETARWKFQIELYYKFVRMTFSDNAVWCIVVWPDLLGTGVCLFQFLLLYMSLFSVMWRARLKWQHRQLYSTHWTRCCILSYRIELSINVC